MTLFVPRADDPLGSWSELDPALLAFVKCHVTSILSWEALRFLAAHTGELLPVEEIARATHKGVPAVARAMAELAGQGVVDEVVDPQATRRYRLPAGEPTTVVLRRLIEVATHSQEMRSIIAAHLLHSRNGLAV
jgi:DNA-binding transcriptional ArsR family regulator